MMRSKELVVYCSLVQRRIVKALNLESIGHAQRLAIVETTYPSDPPHRPAFRPPFQTRCTDLDKRYHSTRRALIFSSRRSGRYRRSTQTKFRSPSHRGKVARRHERRSLCRRFTPSCWRMNEPPAMFVNGVCRNVSTIRRDSVKYSHLCRQTFRGWGKGL
jgi:hypothetical protein